MSARPAGTCFHCGEPVPAGAPIWAILGDVRQPMCCVGCKAVAELIHDQRLGAYYEHRRPPSAAESLRVEAADWSAWDHEDLLARYVHRKGDVAEATVDIGGMYCSACAWLLDTGLGRHPAVRNIALNPATRRAVVRWDAERLGFGGLLAAIAALGFKPAPANAAASEQQGVDEQRQALRRLIVAAAAGMQVMMFAVALYAGDYFGIEGRIEQFLRLTSLLVCLPIVFYSARPFFAGAFRGVAAGRPGMDLPVSIAIAAAFAASAYAALANRGEVYFDSVAMFVLFLGGARYLEMRTRHRAEDGARAMAALLPETATRLAGNAGGGATGNTPEVVGVDRLRVGDQVLVRPGDVVPADGRVLSGELSADESLLTGESMPVTRVPGTAVFAGAMNRAGTAIVEVTQTGASTSIAEIGRMIDRAKADRPPIALLADRIAGHFVVAVLAVAALAGIAWGQVDPRRAFEVVLATLVVTCPCALSLATPAALAAAATRLARQGILLVRARVLEVLAKPAHIVFDKTGTLTEGRPVITNVRRFSSLPAKACVKLAAAMETMSEHVLARAFAGYDTAGVAVSGARVEPGQGIEACIGDRHLRLGRYDYVAALAGLAGDVSPDDPPSIPPDDPPNDRQNDRPDDPSDGVATAAWLGDAHGMLACFSIGDALREDAAASVQALGSLGHAISIASGDRAGAVATTARQLGVRDWQAGMTPAGKLEFIAGLRGKGEQVVMVGDGINDAPVLAAADASIAVDAGTALARASADVVVPGRRLSSVVEVAATARLTRRVVAQNVGWAIAYNACAVPLAVAGLLAPWMAAIGMSLSSLLVVGNALRLQRRMPRSLVAEAPGTRSDVESAAAT